MNNVFFLTFLIDKIGIPMFPASLTSNFCFDKILYFYLLFLTDNRHIKKYHFYFLKIDKSINRFFLNHKLKSFYLKKNSNYFSLS